MIRFTTESGSVYELDDKRVRRLTGTNNPTPRQGPDGEWKPLADVIPPKLVEGTRVYLVWRYDETEEGQIARGTMTSRIVKMEEV